MTYLQRVQPNPQTRVSLACETSKSSISHPSWHFGHSISRSCNQSMGLNFPGSFMLLFAEQLMLEILSSLCSGYTVGGGARVFLGARGGGTVALGKENSLFSVPTNVCRRALAKLRLGFLLAETWRKPERVLRTTGKAHWTSNPALHFQWSSLRLLRPLLLLLASLDRPDRC